MTLVINHYGTFRAKVRRTLLWNPLLIEFPRDGNCVAYNAVYRVNSGLQLSRYFVDVQVSPPTQEISFKLDSIETQNLPQALELQLAQVM